MRKIVTAVVAAGLVFSASPAHAAEPERKYNKAECVIDRPAGKADVTVRLEANWNMHPDEKSVDPIWGRVVAYYYDGDLVKRVGLSESYVSFRWSDAVLQSKTLKNPPVWEGNRISSPSTGKFGVQGQPRYEAIGRFGLDTCRVVLHQPYF